MHKSWMWKQRSYREQFQGDEGNGAAGGAAEAQQQDGDQAQADEQLEDETSADEPQASAQADDQDADDGVIVTIGDETPLAASDDEIEGKPAPAWVKELRKEHRELQRQKRDLEQQLAATKQAQQPQAITVGEKPTLESCDYDAEKYGEELLAWTDRKKQVEAQAAKQREEQEAAQAAWNAKLTSYQTAKASLKVPDFDDAEHLVTSTMDATQQAIILKLPKPELMVYAVGKNPAKAKELAAIKDPIDFAFAVAKLETQLKVQPRKMPPAPETKVRGTTGGATAVDNTLARLEAEADRTGDRTKVAAYHRQKRQAAA
jgi:hypothetical protein